MGGDEEVSQMLRSEQKRSKSPTSVGAHPAENNNIPQDSGHSVLPRLSITWYHVRTNFPYTKLQYFRI